MHTEGPPFSHSFFIADFIISSLFVFSLFFILSSISPFLLFMTQFLSHSLSLRLFLFCLLFLSIAVFHCSVHFYLLMSHSLTYSPLPPFISFAYFFLSFFLSSLSFCSPQTRHVSPLGNTNPLRSQGGALDNAVLSQL